MVSDSPSDDANPSFDELALLSPEWHNLDFALVGPPITQALKRTIVELERRWPAQKLGPEGASILLRSLVAIATNDYRAAMYLCKEIPEAEAAPIEFGLAISPLVRRILEALLQLVFILDDLPRNTVRYYQKGWKDLQEENALIQRHHGGDQKWADYLQARVDHAAGFGQLAGITTGSAGQPNGLLKPPYPSNPGQLTSPRKRGLFRNRERSDYCIYLGKWFYAALSQESHLTFAGVGRQLPVVLRERSKKSEQIIARRKGVAVGTMLTLLLAILSEVESEFGYGEKENLIYLWTMMSAHSDEAGDLYRRRYAYLLRGAS